MSTHSAPTKQYFVPPCGAKKGNKKQCLWLTHLNGSEAIGSVTQCYFDDDKSLFAIKDVMPCQSRMPMIILQWVQGVPCIRECILNQILDTHITPHCYSVSRGKGNFTLVLSLCEGALNTWDELNLWERWAPVITLKWCHIDETFLSITSLWLGAKSPQS